MINPGKLFKVSTAFHTGSGRPWRPCIFENSHLFLDMALDDDFGFTCNVFSGHGNLFCVLAYYFNSLVNKQYHLNLHICVHYK